MSMGEKSGVKGEIGSTQIRAVGYFRTRARVVNYGGEKLGVHGDGALLALIIPIGREEAHHLNVDRVRRMANWVASLNRFLLRQKIEIRLRRFK